MNITVLSQDKDLFSGEIIEDKVPVIGGLDLLHTYVTAENKHPFSFKSKDIFLSFRV